MEVNGSKFEGWALIEIMGHQKEIGYVTTEYFGPVCLFRVDTPEMKEEEFELKRPEYFDEGGMLPKGSKVRRPARPAKTRFIGPSAIFAMNPGTEEACKEALNDTYPRPIIPVDVPVKSPQLLQGGSVFHGDHDDE